MKALRLIIPLLIAVSILIASGAVAEGTLAARSSNIVKYVRWTRVTAPTPAEMSIGGQGVQGSPGVYDGLSAPARDIQSDLSIPNDPYLDRQWALRETQALESLQFTTGNQGVIVAILDTGIDQYHEDLKDKVAVEVDFTDSRVPGDINGHGTHIAGIIAANTNNGRGVVGVAPESRLMSVKVADDKGRSQTKAVARGIIWAVDNGASVINISIEFEESPPELEKAVDYAWSRGAVIVAAAGNRGNQLPVYPAYYVNSIAVAAIREDKTLAPLSNWGDWVDVAAPGFDIYSTLPDNSYGYKDGTSFAAAYVSGLAARLFGMVTDTDGDGRLNDEVWAAIEAGCQPGGAGGVGAGRIDVANSVNELSRTQ
jgi:thermitase